MTMCDGEQPEGFGMLLLVAWAVAVLVLGGVEMMLAWVVSC